MKKLILKLKTTTINSIEWLIKKLENIHFRLSKKNSGNSNYSSLSPIDFADEDDNYYDAILWALENRKSQDIKNIALTGSYGSGKSSILKTFQKKYKGLELKFLNISLATFKEEKVGLDSVDDDKKKSKELLRLIETSILQQIFYQEKDRNIPDSNFKKIRHYKRGKLIVLSLATIIYFISLINFFIEDFLFSLFKIAEPTISLAWYVRYIGLTIIGIGTFFILYKSIRLLSSIAISKLKIRDLEIGLEKSVYKSVLNQHIDEILYFFSVRPYNVIIIEDLDRFRETEIFTKLRELNLLLNNSKKNKESEIVFIYAVRDDMFTDRDRTKFFDFIIPVIPVINSTNSKEILFRKKELLESNLSDDFLEEVSYFIDDMRLLHNIINEFIIYRKKLSDELEENKLFAIILYKNIQPNDFFMLGQNEGVLYTCFESKKSLINLKVETINLEIETLKNEVLRLKEILKTDIKELRAQYVLKVISQINQLFYSFKKDNQSIKIDAVLEDENFRWLELDDLKFSNSYHSGNHSFNRFSEIEKLVNPNRSYSERATEIESIRQNTIREKQKEIATLEKKKRETRNERLSELLTSNLEFELPESEMLQILLKKGFISEDYSNYISLFHEKSITQADYKFILSVKKSEPLQFDFQLEKIEKIIDRLEERDFKSPAILNHSIVNFILQDSSNYQSEIELLFTQLSEAEEHSIQFIKEFITNKEGLDKFYLNLCKRWNGILKQLNADPSISDENFKEIVIDILLSADIESIKSISKEFELKKYFLDDSQFTSIIDNTKRLKEVIRELDLYIFKIDFLTTPKDILEFLYQSHRYELSPENAEGMIKSFGKFNEKNFSTSNYKSITESEARHLIDYVESDLEYYFDHVYSEIETNINEYEKYLLSLLNSEGLNIEYKKKIIKQVETKISSISKIFNDEVFPFLFELGRITPTWENLLYTYEKEMKIRKDEAPNDKTIPNYINKYLNIIDNSEALSEEKYPRERSEAQAFWGHLIRSSEIENSSFIYLTKNPPWCYENIDLENTEEDRVQILIENNCFRPKSGVFNDLKLYHSNHHIAHFEKQTQKYMEVFDELNIDEKDTKEILKSNKIAIDHKSEFILKISKEIKPIPSVLNAIAELKNENKSLEVEDEVIRMILLESSIKNIPRIRIFILNVSSFNFDFISQFLNELNGQYKEITNKDKRAIISDIPLNKSLLEALKESQYISNFRPEKKGLRVYHKYSN